MNDDLYVHLPDPAVICGCGKQHCRYDGEVWPCRVMAHSYMERVRREILAEFERTIREREDKETRPT